jgi:signal transduction histidine kinase
MTQRLRHKGQSFLLRDPYDAFDVLQLADILAQKQRAARQAEVKQSTLNRTILQLNSDLNHKEAAPRQKNRVDSTSSMAGVLTYELCPIAPLESDFTMVSDIIDRLTATIALRTTERVLVKVENGAPRATIVANRFRIHDALERLCRSALDATMLRGVITIDATTFGANDLRSVTADQTDCSLSFRRYVAIRISDTGCSIPINVRDRIFTPFLTHKDTKWAMESEFSSVHEIVQQHGGWVEIESSLSVGTSVVINLPLVDLPPPLPLAEKSFENRGLASIPNSSNSTWGAFPFSGKAPAPGFADTAIPHLNISHLTGSICNFE